MIARNDLEEKLLERLSGELSVCIEERNTAIRHAINLKTRLRAEKKNVAALERKIDTMHVDHAVKVMELEEQLYLKGNLNLSMQAGNVDEAVPDGSSFAQQKARQQEEEEEKCDSAVSSKEILSAQPASESA
ncbi:MAG: hypothetical protein SGCHY_004797 [Lobulomycetales sp.]